jgi:hypothetical protein
VVSESDPSHIPEPPGWTPQQGIGALEEHLAQLWGAWAVLAPQARWPKLSCFPAVVAFENSDAAGHWVRARVSLLGRGGSGSWLSEQKPRYAARRAHAELQLWLALRLGIDDPCPEELPLSIDTVRSCLASGAPLRPPPGHVLATNPRRRTTP